MSFTVEFLSRIDRVSYYTTAEITSIKYHHFEKLIPFKWNFKYLKTTQGHHLIDNIKPSRFLSIHINCDTFSHVDIFNATRAVGFDNAKNQEADCEYDGEDRQNFTSYLPVHLGPCDGTFFVQIYFVWVVFRIDLYNAWMSSRTGIRLIVDFIDGM